MIVFRDAIPTATVPSRRCGRAKLAARWLADAGSGWLKDPDGVSLLQPEIRGLFGAKESGDHRSN